MLMAFRVLLVAVFWSTLTMLPVAQQVISDRLLNADREPHNWLMYSGTYMSQRHTRLDQITKANVNQLELQWVFQAQSLQAFQATPLVIDGIMYLTQPPNDVVALDARTGRVFWIYSYKPRTTARPCCGQVNRGLAIHGNTLFMGTIDSRLIAIDARDGKPLWRIDVADPELGYALTVAPIVVKNRVIAGPAGGELGIRGFIAAYDVDTGKEAWRFYTVPGPGEPGHDTWQGDDWKTGGAPIWTAGSYDPQLNLTYWGTGNPGPDWNPALRPGDNLYSDSVVALDADTGKLRWHFQFTPNDPYDYDSTQVPVLVDTTWKGVPRKLMMWANRNGFFYVLDRATGEFLAGYPFVKLNWASGLDAKGRPIQTPQPPGTTTFPGSFGATNWYSPSYSPRTGLFYLSAWEEYGLVFRRSEQEYKPGQSYTAGGVASPFANVPMPPFLRGAPINNFVGFTGSGAVIALDPATGEQKWKHEMIDMTTSGILTTASDLLFTGGREGHFMAFDASNGKQLWRASLGSQIVMGPMSYQLDGKQYVVVSAGNSMFTFALRQ
jgi:alcohol dehydrogenase (cytochrome c)